MSSEFHGFPIVDVPMSRLEYNDDYLILSAGSIREGVDGWYSPDKHKSHQYLNQTGQFLRSQHGDEFTRGDHLRSRKLYQNLISSIQRDGMKSPLVTIQWRNPEDIETTIPLNWGVWREFWESKPHGTYQRVIQGCNRLMVLRDLEYEFAPIIDVTDHLNWATIHGECPAMTWVNSEHRSLMENNCQDIGFDWKKAHNELLFD